MSSSPTVPTSTTPSSTSSGSERAEPGAGGVVRDVSQGEPDESPAERHGLPRSALIACGALAQPAAQIVERNGWPVDVHPLPPLLHNQPQRIAGEVRALAGRLRASYDRVVVGYADCGSYGALDTVCDDLGLERLPGLHCYDVYAGSRRIEQIFSAQPGTYLLTDFLVRSFARTVERELGLDRWPELRDDYFGSYTRVVWLAQDPTDPELLPLAEAAAAKLGLPLELEETGTTGLEEALRALLPG